MKIPGAHTSVEIADRSGYRYVILLKKLVVLQVENDLRL